MQSRNAEARHALSEKTSETDDQRIKDVTPLPPPEHLIRFFPIADTPVETLVGSTRNAVRRILAGDDDRLLVIIGPCSIHDPAAAIDYARKLTQKVFASKDVIGEILGTIDTPEKFEAHRLTMAKRVWANMKESDSKECRNCHKFDKMDTTKQKDRSVVKHEGAREDGKTCNDETYYAADKTFVHRRLRTLIGMNVVDGKGTTLGDVEDLLPADAGDGVEIVDQKSVIFKIKHLHNYNL